MYVVRFVVHERLMNYSCGLEGVRKQDRTRRPQKKASSYHRDRPEL